jgi:hypothetical protein
VLEPHRAPGATQAGLGQPHRLIGEEYYALMELKGELLSVGLRRAVALAPPALCRQALADAERDTEDEP